MSFSLKDILEWWTGKNSVNDVDMTIQHLLERIQLIQEEIIGKDPSFNTDFKVFKEDIQELFFRYTSRLNSSKRRQATGLPLIRMYLPIINKLNITVHTTDNRTDLNRKLAEIFTELATARIKRI